GDAAAVDAGGKLCARLSDLLARRQEDLLLGLAQDRRHLPARELLIRLVLKPGREASVLRRHPWVFSGAIARGEAEDAGEDAGIAEVADASGRPLALGAYSPDSQIVARLWSFDGRAPGPELFRERFAAARALRREILPPETTGYRAVNSEGDLCP